MSSVTATCKACARRDSVAKERLPGIHYGVQILFNYTLQSADFHPIETAAFLQSDWAQPKLRDVVVAFDVNVRRFRAITCVKEESVWAAAKNRRHRGGILHIRVQHCHSRFAKRLDHCLTRVSASPVGTYMTDPPTL